MDRRPLFVFSPLPPAKNGIVDYMYALLQELQTNYYDCSVFCADVFQRPRITFAYATRPWPFATCTAPTGYCTR